MTGVIDILVYCSLKRHEDTKVDTLPMLKEVPLNEGSSTPNNTHRLFYPVHFPEK